MKKKLPNLYESISFVKRTVDKKQKIIDDRFLKSFVGDLENPKEAIGQAKPSLHHVPPRVLLEVAQAMMEGSKKYGIYNYRKAGVSFSTYYSSTFRHLISWFEGEDIDPDSGLNHVVKAISGLIVLRDSMLENNFIDDRPNTK